MLRCILLCSCVLLLVQLAYQQTTTANESPLIKTTLGRIRGSTMTSRKGRDFYAYRGIYYAKAPTGQRRFAAPEPVEPWNNTLDALADGPTCPQGILTDEFPENEQLDEDCLSLNVYTANITAPRPVIVFLHGGANRYWSPHSENKARPHYLLDEDVVLVAVYYRLGAFGFLTTGTQEAPGNYGYLDQVLALKWVKQHIEKFGGDPNRVTLMGYSSGSIAVTLHLVSPLSAGLFHGAIAMSCSSTNHADADNLDLSRKLAHELGCPKFGAQYLLNCLRKASWQQIIDVCGRWESYRAINMKWNFGIDGSFLVEHPNEAIRNNRFNRVPIMAGVTRNEFDFITQFIQNDADLIDEINLNLGLYTEEILDFPSTGNDDERVKSIRNFYFNTTSISQDNLVSLGVMRSDSVIGHSVHRLVELAKNYTNVYYYRSDYVGELSFFPDSSGNPLGICHGDDVNYILPEINSQVKDTSPDNFMVDRMIKLVSSFAANGAPSMIENVTWPPITADNPVVLYMDKHPYVGGPYYVERYALWDRLFPLEASSAEVQLPAMLLIFFVAVWHLPL